MSGSPKSLYVGKVWKRPLKGSVKPFYLRPKGTQFSIKSNPVLIKFAKKRKFPKVVLMTAMSANVDALSPTRKDENQLVYGDNITRQINELYSWF